MIVDLPASILEKSRAITSTELETHDVSRFFVCNQDLKCIIDFHFKFFATYFIFIVYRIAFMWKRS